MALQRRTPLTHAASCTTRRWIWPLYALAQGTMFWALFVVGHDWCERTPPSPKLKCAHSC